MDSAYSTAEAAGDKLAKSNPLLTYTNLNSCRKAEEGRPSRLKPVHSMKTMYCSLSLCSILLALLGLSYLLFDPLVKKVVLNRLVLRNHSEFAEIWSNPPITPHLKVYFYNLTNPEEFASGEAKPKLQEVGPYTYHQKWIKENVQWHDNGTMSYSTRKEFTFVPELSVGDHSLHNLTLPNVPAISALYQMRKKSYWLKLGLSYILSTLGYKLYMQRTPEELIWGYPEPLFELAKMTLPNPPPLDGFGFFTKKNESKDLPLYTMYTGEGNPYNLSKISLFNGRDSLGVWNGEMCNKVHGSDGATFNPYIQEEETLWFFNDQLCRSMPLVFKETVMSRNLPGYRFVPRSDVFQLNFEKYPHNKCFCEGEELCSMIGDGMFAVSKCQFDAPIVLSWPHFLGMNQTFADSIEGVSPADPEKHGFWFDIQPVTGTTLSAKARIQINLALQTSDLFQGNDTVLPMLWFEEGLDELGPDLLDVIGQAVSQPPIYKNYILFMLLGVFASTTGLVIVAVTRWCLNNRNIKRNRERVVIVDDERFNDIIIAAQQPGPIISNFIKGHAHNPSQGSGKFLLESEDSSRQSSANHSRNSSTGSTPPTFVPLNNVEEDTTPISSKCVNEITRAEDALLDEEQERLLSPRQEDQRSDEDAK